MTAPPPAALDALVENLRFFGAITLDVIPPKPAIEVLIGLARQSADVTTLFRTQVEALTAELDAAKQRVREETSIASQSAELLIKERARALASDTARASAETALAEAREALKPFADLASRIADEHPGWDHDEFQLFASWTGRLYLTMAPFRQARAALEQKT